MYFDKTEKRYCLFVHSHVTDDESTSGDSSGSYLDDFSRALVDYDIHNMGISLVMFCFVLFWFFFLSYLFILFSFILI